ncbi:pilus assembly protein N-terminal domain-containing protein [Zwartia sp.]|uniref:type II and III secretion system protein family protein n=1 Tax=Zwartia sp. TaxID=2978004 RepID=UPI0027228D62|nr:pilus assembly protein N-terminal domain-containing protein [Zwartia sp.]MDO9024086.1 pilus assembly protein N-terminal domain-containing protein [Zwartia sp.]
MCNPFIVLSQTTLNVEVGSSTVIKLTRVERLAIGNSEVLQATVINQNEIVVFGKKAGATTLDVWRTPGQRQSYRIRVTPEGFSRVQEEIKNLLKTVPMARSSVIGDKLIIEGENLSDSDQAKIGRLVQRYPELLDFTSQVGWDKMVLLDVQVIEIPSARVQELGIRWDTSLPMPLKGVGGMPGVSSLLSARINALAQSGEATVLAQPQLLARSGATATFVAGGEVPYTNTDKDGKTTTSFKKYGVSLNITPQVDSSLAVRSKIDIEVSSVDQTLASAAGPALKIRRASTEFNVRSGQTLVLGGFLSRERSRESDGVPGLSEIPFMGSLFGVKSDQYRETELAIFVTPVVVNADHPDMVRRVENAAGIMQEAFGTEQRLNTPIHQQSVLPSWNQEGSMHSQWETLESASAQAPVGLDQWSAAE